MKKKEKTNRGRKMEYNILVDYTGLAESPAAASLPHGLRSSSLLGAAKSASLSLSPHRIPRNKRNDIYGSMNLKEVLFFFLYIFLGCWGGKSSVSLYSCGSSTPLLRDPPHIIQNEDEKTWLGAKYDTEQFLCWSRLFCVLERERDLGLLDRSSPWWP